MHRREIKDVLAELMGDTSANELSRVTGLPQPTISRILAGKSKDPDTETLRPIAIYYRKSIAQVRGEVPLKVKQEMPEYGIVVDEIPIRGKTTGGRGKFWEDNDYPDGYSDRIIDWPSKDPQTYALEIDGNSMSPWVREGEYVVLSPAAQYLPGDEVVLRLQDGEVMVKTLLNERDGAITVTSIANHERHVFRKEQIVFIHKVIGRAPASAAKFK